MKVKIVSSNQVNVAEAEFDELWYFVSEKSHQCWLWWAIDHNTGVPLAYCFGTRENKYLDELRALLAPFRISIVYCNDNSAYKTHITESFVTPGKRNAQRIERKYYLYTLIASLNYIDMCVSRCRSK